MQNQQAFIADIIAQKEDILQELIMLKSASRFYEETAELIEFKNRYQQSPQALAQIILKNFSDGGHFFLIDKGSSAGVCVDMIAVYKNCLVGRVIEVYPYYSKLALITDKSCRVAAYCPTTGVCGIHEGVNNELVTSLEHVSHLQPIHNNDLVISSGDGMIFPRGFGLGTVQYHEIKEGLYHIVRLKPLLDFRALLYCYIVQKGCAMQY